MISDPDIAKLTMPVSQRDHIQGGRFHTSNFSRIWRL
jgi:hypothetical protein